MTTNRQRFAKYKDEMFTFLHRRGVGTGTLREADWGGEGKTTGKASRTVRDTHNKRTQGEADPSPWPSTLSIPALLPLLPV